ncbi:MAG: hypothetical protein HeimC3_18140 [Candidatus Heimdallarchaeota archaeon LC_3]|nr:MAG: hypothetical protein HeimC3_18140 [Candidatus Heimdallarchaeota archaeon LC_3]
MISGQNYLISRISFEQTYDLRHRIMNPEKSINQIKRQDDEKALYLGAIRFKTKHIIGIASFFNEKLPNQSEDQRTYRIRGMAVEEKYQKNGIGKALVLHAMNHLQANVYWCNSRINAVYFYKRLGFKKISNKINIIGFGERYLMVKKDNF